jgi:hypothetical protein
MPKPHLQQKTRRPMAFGAISHLSVNDQILIALGANHLLPSGLYRRPRIRTGSACSQQACGLGLARLPA